MFIVIEGDNGTGKTSVASILNKKHNFEFITEHPDIAELEQKAKSFDIGSIERFEAFLDYNRACGEQSEKHIRSVLARYWISTIAAGYADKLFDINETLTRADSIIKTMPRPDHIFRLKCSFEKRIERIEKRALSDGNDDITAERDKRYSFILDNIQSRYGILTEIDTENTDPDTTVNKILNAIGGK